MSRVGRRLAWRALGSLAAGVLVAVVAFALGDAVVPACPRCDPHQICSEIACVINPAPLISAAVTLGLLAASLTAVTVLRRSTINR